MDPHNDAKTAQEWPDDGSLETLDDREPPIWEPYDVESIDDTNPYEQAGDLLEEEPTVPLKYTPEPNAATASRPRQVEDPADDRKYPHNGHPEDAQRPTPEATQPERPQAPEESQAEEAPAEDLLAETSVEPQAEEVRAQEVRAQEVRAEEVPADEPLAEQAQAQNGESELARSDAPQAEEVPAEEPQAEEAQSDEPHADDRPSEEPQAEELQAEELQAEEPQAEELQAEEPQAEAPPEERQAAEAHSPEPESKAPQLAQPQAEEARYSQPHHEPPYEEQRYDESQYDESRYEQSRHEQSRHEQAQYEQSHYEAAQYEAPRYEHARYEETRYVDATYAEPRYEQSQYKDSQYEENQYDESQYDENQYERTQYSQPQYEAAQYEPSRYEQQRYEQQRYEDQPYEDQGYENQRYEESQYGPSQQYGQPHYAEPEPADPGYQPANNRAHIFDVTVHTRATAWSSPAVTFPRRGEASETITVPPAQPTPRPEDLLAPDNPAIDEAPARWGWRGQLNKLSAGVIKPKPTDAELADRRAVMDIQRGLTRPMTVVVVQPKGGAGKTPTTICLAAAFGVHRGGYVIGWDDNETRGTLAVRVANRDSQRTTVWDLLGALPTFERADARVGDLGYYVRSQGEVHFDALVSDDHPSNMAQIGETEFQRIHAVLQRFYRVIVIDTGNNVRSPNWQAAVNAADVVVVVSTYQRDVGFSGSWVLDHLQQTGRDGLAKHAVTVLTAADPTTDEKVRSELLSHFRARTRHVVEIPYDPHLATGGPIHWPQLSEATRRAWTQAGAVVVNALLARDGVRS